MQRRERDLADLGFALFDVAFEQELGDEGPLSPKVDSRLGAFYREAQL
jgi:hypothetical protein